VKNHEMNEVHDEGLPQTRSFWVWLTVFGSVFATGLFVVFQSFWWGIFYMLVGLAGLIALIRDRLFTKVGRVRTRFLVLVCLAVSALVGQLVSEAIATQNAISMYVLPRQVTEKQAEDLRDYLSRDDPYALSLTVIANDQEAVEYGAQLFNALRRTKWEVNPPGHDFPRVLEGWYGTGLSMKVEATGQPPNANPPHQDPAAVLLDALDKAKIQVGSINRTGGKGACTISIFVGRRPMKVGEKEPVLVRLGNWIRELAVRFN
jgi:hypothetical protein